MAEPPTEPAAMIGAVDARRLADELEELRRAHWSHWTAQEVHVAATAVRHLRLLAEHNSTHGVTVAGHHTFPQETPPIPEEPQSPTTTGGEKE